MTDFRMALIDIISKSPYDIQKMEAKKRIYLAKCAVHGCPWKVRATSVIGWVTVTCYFGEHTCGQFNVGEYTCGQFRPGRDHSMVTLEWIAAKLMSLFDESHNITP